MKTFFNNLNWKYAIGEIIIVTIGITIAFALNNWAAQHKYRQEFIRYYWTQIGGQ